MRVKAQFSEDRERHKGTVLWFDGGLGYGFIRPSDPKLNGGKDIFVHYQGIIQRGFRSLRPDDIVEFSLGKNEKGSIALEVMIRRRAEENV